LRDENGSRVELSRVQKKRPPKAILEEECARGRSPRRILLG